MSQDLFHKCRAFYVDAEYARGIGYPVNPRLAQALGLYPFFIPIDSPEGPEAIIGGRKMIMIGSNNYLGLTQHPKVREAAIEAVRRFGTSSTGSRFLNGTLQLHLELEDRLARFVGQEKALVFSTGYQTNLGAISALMGKGGNIIADRDVHASIIDGIRLSSARRQGGSRYFEHNDMADLEKTLGAVPRESGTLVVVDGVFSMTGDIANLPGIISLCRQYGAKLMVDDAHSLGVLGGGRGTGFHFGCQNDIDLVMGTFSKSFASVGGFVAGDKEVIHWIQHFARPLIFSASLPPPCVATVLAALDVIEQEPERIDRVNQIAQIMKSEFKALGFNIGKSETPIIPLIIGDQFRTLQAWDTLFKAGVYANVAIPPAVPASQSLLRTSFMATHTDDHLNEILSVFVRFREKIGT
jgi:8-amino-7-oxononanoate synthase